MGLLAPSMLPPSLYTIRGPIYVEPAGLQPPLFLGPPVVAPPVVGPPVIGPSVISPSPFNPYATKYPFQMMYDEDEVSPRTRRFNTNTQSGM